MAWLPLDWDGLRDQAKAFPVANPMQDVPIGTAGNRVIAT
jgi:hypothetical protein